MKCLELHNRGQELKDEENFAEALQLFQQVVDGCKSDHHRPLRISSMCNMGQIWRTMGQLERALNILHDAVQELEHPVIPELRLLVFHTLTELMSVVGRYEDARQAAGRAAQEAEHVDDGSMRFFAFHSLADIARLLGRYEEATTALRRAAREAEKLDSLARSTLHTTSGQLFQLQGRHDEAIAQLRLAAEEAEKTGDAIVRSRTLCQLGTALRHADKCEDALLELQQSVKAAKHTEDVATRCNALRALGELLLQMGNYKDALPELTRAALVAEQSDDPMTKCNAVFSMGRWHYEVESWHECTQKLVEAQNLLLQALSQNRQVDAIVNLMQAGYHHIFRMGLNASEKLYRDATNRLTDALQQAISEPVDQSEILGTSRLLLAPSLWDAVGFADGAKCVAIREALRRHVSQTNRPTTSQCWQPTLTAVSALFSSPSIEGKKAESRTAFRNISRGVTTPSTEEVVPPMELPGSIHETKNRFCITVDQEVVDRLLPDNDTVLIVFYFDEKDLVALPISRGKGGVSNVCLTSERSFFRVHDCRESLELLLRRQDEAVDQIVHSRDLGVPGNFADGEIDGEDKMTRIYEELNQVLKTDELLQLIDPTTQRLSELHLVIIPDGPLYRLPLHVACSVANGSRLYERVASVRYGLSLKTLELQQQIEEARADEEAADRGIRGVAFANPHDGPQRIEYVIQEVESLVKEAGPDKWWIHGDVDSPEDQASRENFRAHHNIGNLGWVMSHGVDEETACQHGLTDEFRTEDGGSVRVSESSILLCDGVVSMSRMLAEGYDFSNWRLLNISSCLLGRLRNLGESKEVLGYGAVLALLGCRRVSAALWSLSDESAAAFGRIWIRAILKHAFGPTQPGPHSFATAFKEALTNFRKFEGRFDHEFYWAPYTLYGLG